MAVGVVLWVHFWDTPPRGSYVEFLLKRVQNAKNYTARMGPTRHPPYSHAAVPLVFKSGNLMQAAAVEMDYRPCSGRLSSS
jgi:hypothetical protein